MQACGETFSAAFASASHAQGITENHMSDCRVCHTALRDRRAIASLSVFRLCFRTATCLLVKLGSAPTLVHYYL